MGEDEYQLWLWYALGGYFALAFVMDIFTANVVSLARSHFGSDNLGMVSYTSFDLQVKRVTASTLRLFALCIFTVHSSANST